MGLVDYASSGDDSGSDDDDSLDDDHREPDGFCRYVKQCAENMDNTGNTIQLPVQDWNGINYKLDRVTAVSAKITRTSDGAHGSTVTTLPPTIPKESAVLVLSW